MQYISGNFINDRFFGVKNINTKPSYSVVPLSLPNKTLNSFLIFHMVK